MDLIKPIFAQGQTNKVDLATAITSSGNKFYLSATTNYTINDDHVIIGEVVSSVAVIEYLGLVTGKGTDGGGDYIETEFSTSRNWTTSADVWKATYNLQFNSYIEYPDTTPTRNLNYAYTLIGNEIYSSKMAPDTITFDVTIPRVSESVYNSVESWYRLRSVASSTYFYFFDNTRTGYKVKLLNAPITGDGVIDSNRLGKTLRFDFYCDGTAIS